MFRGFYFLLAVVLTAGCQNSSNKSTRTIFFDPSWSQVSPGAKSANLTGFSVDFISNHLDSDYQFSVYDHLLYQLEQKECDAVIANLPQTGINLEKFAFSPVLIETGPVVITKQANRLTTPSELKGKQIALQANSPTYLIAQQISGVTLVTYDKLPQAFEDLYNEKVDAIIIDLLTALSFCTGVYKDKLHIVSPPLNKEGLQIITLKGRFERLLEGAKDPVTIHNLKKKWGLVLQ